MTNLDIDDYKYFNGKFDEIHSRISDINSDIAAIKIESEERLTRIETTHEVQDSKKKDVMSTISIIGAYIAIGIMFII